MDDIPGGANNGVICTRKGTRARRPNDALVNALQPVARGILDPVCGVNLTDGQRVHDVDGHSAWICEYAAIHRESASNFEYTHAYKLTLFNPASLPLTTHINVTFRTLSGLELCARVHPHITTYELKLHIENTYKHLAHTIRLIHGGKPMRDLDSMEKIGIHDGSTIFIVFQLQGGMPSDDEDDHGNLNTPKKETIQSVNVKTPNFIRSSPQVWFRQLECQFTLNNIKSDEKKFMFAFPALPEDISVEVPAETVKYSELKALILSLSQKSNQQKIEEALGELELNGRKPSQFIRATKTKLTDIGLDPTDEILKHKLIKAMPPETQISMTASQSLSLDAFCAVADNLFELLNRSSVNNVESHPHNKARSDRMQNNISNQGHANHSSNLSNACLPFHPDQKPKICRAHIFYAERARTCKHWCRWPGTKPRIVDSRESSRTNSRENSPVRSNQGN